MSGNGSYIKSMNGIVSFNTGSTIIEGTGITTETIDCDTINAITANISSTINTSTIYVDFLVPAANAFITMIGDVKYNTNIYIDSVFANLGSTINMNNTIATSQIDSITPSATYNFLTSHTGIINFGSATSTNNFNNTIKTTRIDSVTPSAGYLLLTNHTGSINIGSSASVVRFGSITTPVRSAYVPVAGTDLANKDYVDSMSGTSLLSATNVWTGASNTFNNVVNVNSISAPSGTLTVTGNITTTSNITGTIINTNSISAPSGTLTVTGVISTASDITGRDIISSRGYFDSDNPASTCRFARETITGSVTLANGQTTGTLTIGQASGRTGAINIGASGSTTTISGPLIAGGVTGGSACTVWGKKTVEFTGGNDYTIVSGDINNVFMVVVNGPNPRTIQMPARKIGQIVIIRSIATTGVSNQISVSLISGGNFYNPGLNTTALFYSIPSGGTVSYFDNGTNWISF